MPYPPRIDTRCKLPTQAEIAERTAEIRAGWSDVDYYKRARWLGRGVVEIQVADIPGCDRAGANL